jgi:D-cysteine desulfhydrase
VGRDLWVKRDDLTGSALSGNKVRKLDFLAAAALEEGCDVLVTCGAVTSNHARATAVAAGRLGLESHLVLRGTLPERPEGNVLLDRLLGARITTITPAEWPARDEAMARVAAQERARGRRPYLIPEGGSNAIGSMGYALAAREILEQCQAMAVEPGCVVHATGSGGTTAGLSLGFAAMGREDVEVLGVAVCDDAEYFDAVVQRIHAEAVARGFVTREVRARARWRILEGHKGEGYAKTTPREMEFLARVARREGLVLDPVYTGKAFSAFLEEARHGRLRPEGVPIFLHTGGIFGLFHFAREVGALGL